MIDLTDDDIVFLAEPHEYVVRGRKVPSVTQVIEEAGLGEDFYLVPPDVLRMAQSRGNAVHLACAYLDAGELDIGSVDERVWGYVQAYQSFRNTLVVKTVAVEQRLASPMTHTPSPWSQDKNGPPWLAGTPDLIGFIEGRRSVVDLKTGQVSGAGLQTAGYKLLWDSLHPAAPVYDRYSLKLNRDGTFRLRREEDPDDAPAFLWALEKAAVDRQGQRWVEKYGKQ